MAPLAFNQILASKLYKFSAGPNKTEFTMHSALVSAQSPALDCLVNGDFKEALESHTVLDHVDEETFTLFSQYAYTGNYNILGGTRMQIHLLAQPPVGFQAPVGFQPPMSLTSSASSPSTALDTLKPGTFSTAGEEIIMKRHTPETLWKEFNAAGLMPSGPPPSRPGVILRNGDNILICHAKVFVFADYFGIEALTALAFRKLKTELLFISTGDNMQVQLADNAAELIEFCFTELVPETLKNHVVLYAASKSADLWWKSEKFRDLVRNCHEFSAALIRVMIEGLQAQASA
ncbi:hypothetical protein B0T16DRAFT_458657 [Cercophora newfieldiana]|uniref:BTB domain-containing protein n=1 Tax=Cercophora newfieldiana TaxID=92897 RepID=A0AA39Y6D1_9PEZI|nr:hypothetical protein B0T16DRAFT_458657 [Cercophora newfieldiana]